MAPMITGMTKHSSIIVVVVVIMMMMDELIFQFHV
jgi:hypothetical protein